MAAKSSATCEKTGTLFDEGQRLLELFQDPRQEPEARAFQPHRVPGRSGDGFDVSVTYRVQGIGYRGPEPILPYPE